MREMRAKEEKRRQEEFLEQTYQEQQLAQDAEAWDPIEDVLDNERDTYIDLIKHFLWLADDDFEEAEKDTGGSVEPENLEPETAPEAQPKQEEAPAATPAAVDQRTPSKNKRKGKKGKKQGAPARPSAEGVLTAGNGLQDPLDTANGNQPVPTPATPGSASETKPDIERTESREEMRKRLIEGMKLDIGPGARILMKGTLDNPEVTSDRMPNIPADEVDRLLHEVAEIKNYLFCRLLLGHQRLFPAAMRASTIEQLFCNPEVTASDLRDICLKMEQPRLQDIRDACADFFRGNEEGDDETDTPQDEEDSESSDDEDDWIVKRRGKGQTIPDTWTSKREKKQSAAREEKPPEMINMMKRMGMGDGEAESGGEKIDFGELDDNEGVMKKIGLKICGRQIYYYPSAKSMSRSGWLHFSIIAKDCSFFKAVELCKTWDEFFELNVLAINFYFPSPTWLLWAGDMMKKQLLMMGFIPFYTNNQATSSTFSKNERVRGRGRVHITRELRNYICAQMRRNDPVTRRFLQYVSMQSCRMMVVVRGGKTGKVIEKPPDEEAWLARERMGHGRASRTPWTIVKRIDEKFFSEMEQLRAFRFGFDDFYEVCIWSSTAGEPFEMLYSSIFEMLYKAHRAVRPADHYNAAAPHLKTLTREETGRVRNIKPNEQARSLLDVYQDKDTTFRFHRPDGTVLKEPPRFLLYNEADKLEDEVLFPEQLTGDAGANRVKKIKNRLTDFEQGRMKNFLDRWVNDIDTDDEDFSDESDDGWESTDSLQSGSRSPDENDVDGTDGESQEGDDEPVLGEWAGYVAAAQKAEGILDSFGPGPNDHMGESQSMKFEFMEFSERSKANVFKESWHKADREPGAFERWQEYLEIRRKADGSPHLMTAIVADCWNTLKFLDYHPDTHSRTKRDVQRAYTMTSLYFPVGRTFFKEDEPGYPYKDSLLFKQHERAQLLPDRRGYQSPSYRSDAFFKELDDVKKRCRKNGVHILDELPLEWDIAVRPKIAHLFREGIICISHRPSDDIPGQVFAGHEKDRPLDLFFDFRPIIPEITIPAGREDPTKISVAQLQQRVHSFGESRSNARFSFLRLWSAPDFYPLMIGSGNRSWTSFTDVIGRIWEWKFIPKDMPKSEWSMHFNLQGRMQPFKKALGDKVVVKRDMLLILAENEEELLLLTSAVTFAIQTRPWRLEVDYWKSFINVDIGFLDSLRDEWYD